MKKNLLIILLMIIGFAVGAFAQQKKIESGEYYIAIQKAEYNMEQVSRREKSTLEVFSGGVPKVVSTELEEFLMPDKNRYVSTSDYGGETRRLEAIRIGKNIYKKENDKEWTKEKFWGLGKSGTSSRLTEIQEYSVENVSVGNLSLKLYRFYGVYEEVNAKEGEEKQKFQEYKTWINTKGLKIKEEIITGNPASKANTYREITEIEYAPKIIIRAPIK